MANQGEGAKNARKKKSEISPNEKGRLYNQYIVPHYTDIYTLTRRYTDKYQDIDENYNYVLAQMYNYIGSYDPSKSLSTWIHIVTKRACFNQNKKRALESSQHTDIEMCSEGQLHSGRNNTVQPVIGSLVDNVSDTVYAALMQIPPHRLSPFLLFAQGYGIRDITAMEWKAGHLEKRSEDIVKSRIFWARKELQYLLKKNGITKANHQGKGHD